jgi:ABC-2 type transport system permease protein
VKLIKYLRDRYRYSVILLKQLVITDFKLRYKNSALGYVWSMLRPLLLFLVLYVIFVVFLKIRSDTSDPAVYLLLGIMIWSNFTEVTTRSITSVVERSDILRKLNFPKYIIVFSVVASALINLVLSMIVVFVFMAFGASQPLPIALVMVPLLFLELFIFAIGIGFLLSALYVKLRDVNYIWEIILLAGFYATPILYPVSLIIDKSLVAAKILMLNPAAQVIQDIRYYLVDQNTVTASTIFGGGPYKYIPIFISISVFIIGAMVFRKKSKYFAEDI